MADFSLYFPRLRAAEGGYCHTPGDAGQETWCGVARAFHPEWPGWSLVDAAKARLGLQSPVPATRWPALNRALAADPALLRYAQALYQAQYWDALRLGELRAQPVAEQLADHAVNAGAGRPVRMLQYALRQLGYAAVAEDGRIGPITLKAANDCAPARLFAELVALRRAFYRYRAGLLVLPPTAPLAGLFARLRLRPDALQAKFLPAWLARVAAIPGPPAL